tara:strand:+ start:4009 stop:5691 length:1683 start_codon:yes stop_codon:yes gene_type:complete
MTIVNKRAPGRRKRVYYNKGRQVDQISLDEAKVLLKASFPLQKDMLIEYLHFFNDKYNGLYARHLRALSELMKLSMSEVYEVASFYAHFHLVDGENIISPEVTVKVCDSVTCEMYGAEKIFTEAKLKHKNVRVEKAPCMGRCNYAPVVEVNHNHLLKANNKAIDQAIINKDFSYSNEKFIDFDTYTNNGGYKLYNKIIKKDVTFEQMIDIFSVSELRGLGGAGFPAFKKWQFVKSYKGPRLMCINADEGEPGTFKDRYYLNKDPHRFLEGTLVAAKLVEAEKCYIYIRDEYYGLIKLIEKQINILEDKKIIPENFLLIRRGAGAYICGEESALIESIEGKRGLPRNRPPYVAEVGLFGRPTLVHNVETVYWIREIYEKGGKWFSSHGRNGRKGLRTFSVSGFVKKPGIKLTDAGITIKQLIEEHCEGMLDGHQFKGYLPGGASGGILPASLGDIPLDFDTLQEYDCFIGSAAVVVLSDKVNMKDIGLNLMRFFEDESCGQCTPCRNGTSMAVKLMQEKKWNVELLMELSKTMNKASICGLGQAAPNPLQSIIRYFKKDIS